MSKKCKEEELSAAAEKVKHYGFALATVYMCYFTYGIQALILSQNKVNFYTQWGITDPTAGSRRGFDGNCRHGIRQTAKRMDWRRALRPRWT